MKRFLIVSAALTFGILLLLGIGLYAEDKTMPAGCPMSKAAATETNATMAVAKEGEQTVVLSVSNMTCGGCVRRRYLLIFLYRLLRCMPSLSAVWLTL